MEQKELQEKAILYQLMQRQLEELSQNAMLIDKRYAELDLTLQALEDVDKLKEKNEILVPLGSGIFTYGRVTDKKILAEIGAGMLLDKDAESARQLIQGKKKEIEKLALDLQGEMVSISSSMNSLVSEIEKASQESEKARSHDRKPKA